MLLLETACIYHYSVASCELLKICTCMPSSVVAAAQHLKTELFPNYRKSLVA